MLKGRDKIGTLDREITFIQPIYENGDSKEDKIIGWEEISSYPTVTARKIEQDGNTAIENGRITFSQQTNWVIRWRDDLNVRMRLVWDTKVYQIVSITEADESRRRFVNIVTNILDNEYYT